MTATGTLLLLAGFDHGETPKGRQRRPAIPASRGPLLGRDPAFFAPTPQRLNGRLIPRSAEWLTREIGPLATDVTKLPAKTRPTLHEVRALSDKLYRARGDTKDTIRQRNAHRSESTTDIYLAGQIIYNEVACDLELEPKQ